MRRLLLMRVPALLLTLASVLWSAMPADAAGVRLPQRPWQQIARRVCDQPTVPGIAACGALIRADLLPRLRPESSPFGFSGFYGPADLWSAYQLPLNPADFSSPSPFQWNGQTVAIVDAYDDPRAASDLTTYRRQFNLPPCTTSNGCFLKVNQRGQQGNYPFPNIGWAEEISLDLAMVSAVCPQCRILLVEGQDASFQSLGTAENTAASFGGTFSGFRWTRATAISNSYGASEFAGEASYESFYNHPGIAITVSAGDSGYGVEYPAASQYVTAVGGTTLAKNGNPGRPGGWDESAWAGTGSGCSAYIPRPSWQTPAIDPGCGMRTVADVAAVADPNTGVLVYDSFGIRAGWYVFGGTSVAAPVIASVYALAGNAGVVTAGSYSYARAGSLFDVASGSNGGCGSYLCTAGPGYDGPTGNGTPNGTGAF